MALLTGNDGSLVVGSATVAALRNFSIEQTADTIETTTMGKDVRTYVKGMSAWSGSADIYFDDGLSSTSTFFPAVSGTSVGGSPVVLKAYVNQAATGNDIAFTGTVIITGFTVNSAMDGIVEASISFQGSDTLNFSKDGQTA
jgi:predicted secreted protein